MRIAPSHLSVAHPLPLQRSSELLKIAESMASGIIDFDEDVHSRSERRKKRRLDSAEMNRFRVLVDMLEKDLETFQVRSRRKTGYVLADERLLLEEWCVRACVRFTTVQAPP
jgi:hypothetical protein